MKEYKKRIADLLLADKLEAILAKESFEINFAGVIAELAQPVH